MRIVMAGHDTTSKMWERLVGKTEMPMVMVASRTTMCELEAWSGKWRQDSEVHDSVLRGVGRGRSGQDCSGVISAKE